MPPGEADEAILRLQQKRLEEKRIEVTQAHITLRQLHNAELEALEWHRKLLENATNELQCSMLPLPHTAAVEAGLELLRQRAMYMGQELVGLEAELAPLRLLAQVRWHCYQRV